MRSMTRKGLLWSVLGFILALAFISMAGADEGAYTNAIMRPDRETRLRWIEDYERAPLAHVDEELSFRIPLRGSLSLLSHLKYTPSERDQGSCENCWVWPGTGIMGIALSVQTGILDRLSIQYLNSCGNTGIDYACCGGWLSDVEDFYKSAGKAIPWSNTNAGWEDGSSWCSAGSSAISCPSVATSPNYPMTSITTETVSTQNVGQAEAIANIKNVLNQNRGVFFGFFLGASEDWDAFFSFWNNKSEDVVWNFDDSCGKTYTPFGGGHAVLCVGYNDDDPNNSYWIIVNSWGTTPNRPNGIFRLDMDMDYDCVFYDRGWYWSYYWQTLDVDFSIEKEVHYVEPSGLCGGNTPCYVTVQEAINAAGSEAIIKIAEGIYHEDASLSTAKDLTLQGGWDSAFTTRSSSSTINSLTISSGTVTVEYLMFQ